MPEVEFYHKLWRQPWISLLKPDNVKKPAIILRQIITGFVTNGGITNLYQETEEQNTLQRQNKAIVWNTSDAVVELSSSDIAHEDDLLFRQQIYAKKIL